MLYVISEIASIIYKSSDTMWLSWNLHWIFPYGSHHIFYTVVLKQWVSIFNYCKLNIFGFLTFRRTQVESHLLDLWYCKVKYLPIAYWLKVEEIRDSCNMGCFLTPWIPREYNHCAHAHLDCLLVYKNRTRVWNCQRKLPAKVFLVAASLFLSCRLVW